LGRVWCGWACPHTVFLDHVYRRIERLVEGDALKRRALAAAPLSAGKFFKVGLKHGLYIIVSAVITHLLLAYFVSLPEVWAMVRAAPTEHWGAFGFIAVATSALYFNFAWFREQLCIVVCPYGRIQSALIDDNSLVVGYDVKRGEPRGKAGTVGAGDCIACSRCVQVCPTGIDIKQGLQMECVGCTACIDACDDVMTKINRPTGLIRYDSQNGFAGRKTRWFRPRVALYGFLLVVGASVALWAISTIRPANLAVTRIIGTPYFVTEDYVRNQFLVRVVNKRNQTQRYLVSVNRAPASLVQNGLTSVVEVPALGEIVQPLVLQLPRRDYKGAFGFEIRIEDVGGHFHLERDVEFLGPDHQNQRRHRHEKEEEKNEHGKKH
jgi:cytochrome c oxidase accessory protein FixG